jgi:hypothetical protein
MAPPYAPQGGRPARVFFASSMEAPRLGLGFAGFCAGAPTLGWVLGRGPCSLAVGFCGVSVGFGGLAGARNSPEPAKALCGAVAELASTSTKHFQKNPEMGLPDLLRCT